MELLKNLFGKKEGKVSVAANENMPVAASDSIPQVSNVHDNIAALNGNTSAVSPKEEGEDPELDKAVSEVVFHDDPDPAVSESTENAAAQSAVKLQIQNFDQASSTPQVETKMTMQSLNSFKETRIPNTIVASDVPTAANDDVLIKDGNVPDWAKDSETAAVAEVSTESVASEAPKEEVADTLGSTSRKLEMSHITNVRENFVETPNSGDSLEKVVAVAQEKISKVEAEALMDDVINKVTKATTNSAIASKTEAAPEPVVVAPKKVSGIVEQSPVQSNIPIQEVQSIPEEKKIAVTTESTINNVPEKVAASDNKPEIVSSSPKRKKLHEAVANALEKRAENNNTPVSISEIPKKPEVIPVVDIKKAA